MYIEWILCLRLRGQQTHRRKWFIQLYQSLFHSFHEFIYFAFYRTVVHGTVAVAGSYMFSAYTVTYMSEYALNILLLSDDDKLNSSPHKSRVLYDMIHAVDWFESTQRRIEPSSTHVWGRARHTNHEYDVHVVTCNVRMYHAMVIIPSSALGKWKSTVHRQNRQRATVGRLLCRRLENRRVKHGIVFNTYCHIVIVLSRSMQVFID